MILQGENGVKIELYEGVKDTPAIVLLNFQLHLMQHAGMGSTMEAIDSRFERLDTFLSNSMVQEAIDERKNMRFGFYMMLQLLDTRCPAIACMVKSIDGVPVRVRTDEEIERVARIIQDGEITSAELDELMETIKKKVDEDLEMYMPDLFSNNDELMLMSDVVKRALLQIGTVVREEANEVELKELDIRLAQAIRPRCFESGNPENDMIKAEKSFARLCATLRKQGIPSPEEMPVLDFYMNIEILKDDIKQKTKMAKQQS